MSATDDPFLSPEDLAEPSIAQAGFHSICLGCDEPIDPGDPIRLDGSGEWVHVECVW